MKRFRERIEIATAEGVRFGLPLAGPVARFVAWMLDALAIFAATAAVWKILAALQALSSDWYGAAATIAFFAISIGYGIFFEWTWAGQTPGKRLLGLRVVDAQGMKLRFPQIAIRNLIRFVDSLPLFYLVGGATMLLNRDAQRLGDIAANTVVIRQSRLEPVDPAAFETGKYNSLLGYPHAVAVLRQKARPELVEIAMQAVGRRDEFAPEAQARVFRELSAEFRRLAEIPDEMDSLPDEQLVRNILQAVTAPVRSRVD